MSRARLPQAPAYWYDGSMPPFVSHSTTTSAPASAAVFTTSRAYDGLAR